MLIDALEAEMIRVRGIVAKYTDPSQRNLHPYAVVTANARLREARVAIESGDVDAERRALDGLRSVADLTLPG